MKPEVGKIYRVRDDLKARSFIIAEVETSDCKTFSYVYAEDWPRVCGWGIRLIRAEEGVLGDNIEEVPLLNTKAMIELRKLEGWT